ncbi:EamA family transporter [Aquabacterium sp. OR-4]|uniref:EamA family transporter n=1 Tax=Aquabacterium sp. OR-4 TaxID=2978127 RepID=UPI0021B2E408|nr:EamA family transporter [Aquabacterium sp. OR-4]MDT7838214.1 EamA family transporter [Aquabacterium sp. OR-4]
MPLTALALILVAALLHAGWNIVAKRADGGPHFALWSALAVSLLWAPLGLWLTWQHAPGFSWREWALILASGLVHVAYFQVLLTGYRRADLTVVYPVARGTGPLVAAAGAVLLLGETLSARGAAGVLGVCAGVFLIAGGPALLARRHAAAQRSRVLAGLRWGGLTGLLIAVYTVIDGYAVKVALISPIVLDYLGNLLRLPVLGPRALADRAGFLAEGRRNWRAVLLMGAVSPLAYVLVLYAVQLAPLSHVAPAREVSMLFAALIGGKLLGEGDRRARLAGAACIALGVMLLAL